MTRPRAIPRQIEVFKDPQGLAEAASALFAREARATIARAGRFNVALSGGATPRATYEAIAREDVDWRAVHFFWGDERIVPMDDPESNFRLARESLLDRIAIPADNVHRVPTELNDPRGIAQSYELLLRRHFHHGGSKLPEFPRFDFVFLGLGQDGHTASLFPEGTPGENGPAWVIAPFAPKLRRFRISLTYGVLNAASLAVFLVEGGEKASILAEVLSRRQVMSPILPAARIHPAQGRLVFLLDEAVARELPETVLEAGQPHVDRQTARRASGF